MSTTQAQAQTTSATGAATRDLKLEVVIIPVSDVDQAQQFYGETLGWRQDADIVVGDAFRVVQFTPPGSGCSVAFGKGVTAGAPGSAAGLELIVSDIVAARDELAARGVEVTEVFNGSPFNPAGRISGPDPERTSYKSYAAFADPDGNLWLLHEVTTRLLGRVAGDTAYVSVDDLAQALKRAEHAHGEHEQRTGERDADWPHWYAAYMIAERGGTELPA